MIPNKTLIIPKSDEIRSEAIETIIERLGIAKAAFFIRETMSQKLDYLKLKDRLFAGKTSSDLYGEIKKSMNSE
jgi:hypothetical protein